ncbi:alpha/beta hydrolase fold domain-containing protein [Pelagicoccus mobilis]|uniref:Alpha/beta hydrolase fold domain-containing protein n=1 Tax=Pelagicoccus mobilis TaxID=415221 RepID=A0A934RT38_9BACT|nr:alpha/beta hydrolase fold domain-containing protein [Pelagicoccus mobilis]MBK1875876.1 alpha/beta hydrolase fold domain-containing protein [Pelagicoccus mobilis]
MTSKRFIVALLSFLLISSFSVCANQAADPAPGKAYTYKEANGVTLDVEIYFPEDWEPSDKRPAMILFHGGGWGKGSLKAFRYQSAYFASRGLVAATASYTLAGKQKDQVEGVSRKRVCIVDAKSAIRWMKENGNQLGIDPEKIIAGGGSAGGHICMLATNNPGLNDPNDSDAYDTSVAAYVLFNPAFGAVDSRDPEVHILKHLKENFPPAVVFFGTKDKWLKGWAEVEQKLESLQYDGLELWMAPGKDHAFFNRQPWKDLTLIEADRFLVELGYLEGEPTLSPKTNEQLFKVGKSSER